MKISSFFSFEEIWFNNDLLTSDTPDALLVLLLLRTLWGNGAACRHSAAVLPSTSLSEPPISSVEILSPCSALPCMCGFKIVCCLFFCCFFFNYDVKFPEGTSQPHVALVYVLERV